MSAARMRTASRPSRKTMTAAFVTTENLRLRAAPDLLLGTGKRIVERRARRGDLVARGAAPEQLDEAVVATGAVPEVTFDLLEERRGEAPEALLRAELEDAVRLESRGLGLFPVARGRRGLKAVERRCDDVEVSGLRGLLPGRRVHWLSMRARGLLGRRLHRCRRLDRRTA